jgi:hypothetical protein
MKLISDREKTHGKFRHNSSMSQSLKDVVRSGKNWNNLTDGQKESLEMICGKIARILAGDATFRDHWDDIEGYARIGGESSSTNLSTVEIDLQEALKA